MNSFSFKKLKVAPEVQEVLQELAIVLFNVSVQ